MASNITEVHLLNVPIGKDYKHTLYFSDRNAQATYFLGRTVHSGTGFSYQRKDNIIRYPKHFDELLDCNYVMYKNTAYGDKWFYAFITNMTYINDERTDIHIETDVLQTWMRDKDYVIKPSFVEREHCYDDTIGIHTVPEGLETGEYVVNSSVKYGQLMGSGIVVATTTDIARLNEDKPGHSGCARYNGISSGVRFYYFNNVQGADDDTNDGGINSLSTLLRVLEIKALSDSVIAIFTCPASFIDKSNSTTVTVTEDSKSYKFTFYKVEESVSAFHKAWDREELYSNKKPKLLDGYTPTNNKLLTYPYTYLNMSNNSGGNAIYKYELFYRGIPDAEDCEFEVYCAITPGCSIRLVPKNYNNVEENNDEGLNGGKYPICGWITDVYTNWLTQNALNNAVSIFTGAAQIAGGVVGSVATGGIGALFGVGSITNGVSQITNTIMQMHQQSLVPPQAEGNLNSGDVTFASSNLTFTGYQMSIKAEYAKIIDQYFNMFGYKLNLVKEVYAGHRENYWYTKTIDVTITGPIPGEDLQKIKDCYNNGITFWKNPVNVGDYSVSNKIVKVYG